MTVQPTFGSFGDFSQPQQTPRSWFSEPTRFGGAAQAAESGSPSASLATWQTIIHSDPNMRQWQEPVSASSFGQLKIGLGGLGSEQSNITGVLPNEPSKSVFENTGTANLFIRPKSWNYWDNTPGAGLSIITNEKEGISSGIIGGFGTYPHSVVNTMGKAGRYFIQTPDEFTNQNFSNNETDAYNLNHSRPLVTGLMKKSLFGGLKEYDSSVETFRPQPNAKRLLIGPCLNSSPTSFLTRMNTEGNQPIISYNCDVQNKEVNVGSELEIGKETIDNTATERKGELRLHTINSDRTDQNLKQSLDSKVQTDRGKHPTGITLKREGYYTIPTLDDLRTYLAEDGTCVVPNFTVGREGFGNIFFDKDIDVAGLNLDEIVPTYSTQRDHPLS